MQNGGEARFAGDVVVVKNPTPPDIASAAIEPQGTVLVLRVAIPSVSGTDAASGDDDSARAAAHVTATVLYGPDSDRRTASASIDLAYADLDAIKRSGVALLKKVGPAAQARAVEAGAEAAKVARQNGEYRGGK